jgi:gamma-glutamyl phosphate reductase
VSKRTVEEVQLEIVSNRTSLSHADSENVAAQYAARVTQAAVDRLKLRRQELFDELADLRSGAEKQAP